MSTVLYIKANPKQQELSRTTQISEYFVEEYKKYHSNDTIIELDLYKEGIKFLSEEGVMMHRPTPEQGREHPILKYAYQFVDADKYIFSEPLWNLSIPAILKAYIDYICITSVTFKYTAEGPVGLCQLKKAVNITTRGGDYSSLPYSQWEMGDRYLKTILSFLGICNYTTIAADKMDVIGVNVDAILNEAKKKAAEVAKLF
jgi:Acyl carrier protein phosphodiesterase